MPTLAIHGGRPTLSKQHFPGRPLPTPTERPSRKDWMRESFGDRSHRKSKAFRTSGPATSERNIALPPYGTAALHIAVAAAGIGPGDEVITTALPSRQALAVLQQTPYPYSWISIPTRSASIRRRSKQDHGAHQGDNPRSIYGQAADMDEMNAIARKHKLTVIEDACQAARRVYKGRKVGSPGQMAAFSLNGSKNLPWRGRLFNTDSDA